MSMARIQAGGTRESLQVGDPLELTRRSLAGRVLPQAASGTVTPIAMGFTYQSRFPAEAWADWYRAKMGSRADVTFFEVPTIGGLATLLRRFIDRGMRSGTPVEFHDRVITVYRGTGGWKRRLSYAREHQDDAYLIALDRVGVVRWIHHGGFDQSQADNMYALLTSLADRGPAAADDHLAPRHVEP
jgi:hypothetical protein